MFMKCIKSHNASRIHVLILRKKNVLTKYGCLHHIGVFIGESVMALFIPDTMVLQDVGKGIGNGLTNIICFYERVLMGEMVMALLVLYVL